MKCKFCGEDNKEALEEHHIVPRRYNGSDRDENLVTVCKNCHGKLESLYDDRFYEQIIEILSSKVEEHPKYECRECEIVIEGEEMKKCPYCSSEKTVPKGDYVKGKSSFQVHDDFT